MPQFPPQGLIWVVCELLAYFTMCTVIPCEMGDATSEITQAVPIPYQQTPELLRDSTCGKGTEKPLAAIQVSGMDPGYICFFPAEGGKGPLKPSQQGRAPRNSTRVTSVTSWKAPREVQLPHTQKHDPRFAIPRWPPVSETGC